MARRKTEPELLQAKQSLAERLKKLRTELFGERGGPELARRLGLPVRTWYNYEAGVTVPAEVVLKVIEMTAVEPVWLLHGQGPQFRLPKSFAMPNGRGVSQSVGEMLRTVVTLLEKNHGASAKPHTGRLAQAVAATESFDHRGGVMTAATPKNGVSERTRSYTRNGVPKLRAEKNACINNRGDAMLPIVADGASVAYSQESEDVTELDGKLVVAWLTDTVIVRWLHVCGRYGVLRPENPASDAEQILIDLEAEPHEAYVRRVLWISTPH